MKAKPSIDEIIRDLDCLDYVLDENMYIPDYVSDSEDEDYKRLSTDFHKSLETARSCLQDMMTKLEKEK